MLIKNHEIDAQKKNVCVCVSILGGSLKTVGFLEESAISSGFSQSLNKNDNWQICKITLASHFQSEIHLMIAFSNPFLISYFQKSNTTPGTTFQFLSNFITKLDGTLIPTQGNPTPGTPRKTRLESRMNLVESPLVFFPVSVGRLVALVRGWDDSPRHTCVLKLQMLQHLQPRYHGEEDEGRFFENFCLRIPNFTEICSYESKFKKHMVQACDNEFFRSIHGTQ